jgi:hypothetical protein
VGVSAPAALRIPVELAAEPDQIVLQDPQVISQRHTARGT